MKSITQKFKIGVLGTANIAVRSIVPALKDLNNYFECVGVATRKISQYSGQNLSGLNLVEGYENLLEIENLDAVYIPLPNSLHYEWVKKSLNKGLHVLVEKSLACNYDQVLELNRIANEKNLALVENFQFRFHSQLQYIQDVILSGILGDLRIFRSSFCFPPFTNEDNIRYNKELGGGALLDAGAYPIKLSQIILGNDLTVSSAVLNTDEKLNVDIWGGACLEQKNDNLFSQIAFGFDNYYQCNVEIVGSKGRLYTNRIFTAGENVLPKIVLETNSEGVKEIELNKDNHFKNMLLYFYDLLSGVKDKEREYSDNINQSRLIEEIKLKANERKR